MKRSLACAALAGLLLAGPLLAMDVEYTQRQNIDYSSFETYGWKGHQYPEGHPLREGSGLDSRLRAIADESMRAIGFILTDEDPDLLLTLTGVETDMLDITGSKYKLAGNVSWIGDPNAHAVRWNRQGTLTFHVIDADSDTVIWSGWATDVAHSPDKMHKKAEKGLKRILRLFPPD